MGNCENSIFCVNFDGKSSEDFMLENTMTWLMFLA